MQIIFNKITDYSIENYRKKINHQHDWLHYHIKYEIVTTINQQHTNVFRCSHNNVTDNLYNSITLYNIVLYAGQAPSSGAHCSSTVAHNGSWFHLNVGNQRPQFNQVPEPASQSSWLNPSHLIAHQPILYWPDALQLHLECVRMQYCILLYYSLFLIYF